MSTPAPFKISVPESALDALKAKLAATTFPPPQPACDDPWEYGVPLADMKRLVEHWRTGYDWRAAEAALNAELPQFTLPISVKDHGTLTAHFVHKHAARKGAIPLLFLHGWPGHFVEVRQILPLLTNPQDDNDPAFDVVAPSLPGFGFSSTPEKADFSVSQYAEFAHNLMQALGYRQYVIQGGDWGFIIAYRIVLLYGPKHAKAWHTNYPCSFTPKFSEHPTLFIKHLLTPYTEYEKKGLVRTEWFDKKAHAYADLHCTTPQTFGYAIADSPAALLAWVYERLVKWSDKYPWTDDEVLTWISIYVFSSTQSTSSAATALRIYFEGERRDEWHAIGEAKQYNSQVPLGVSIFPAEIRVPPRSWRDTIGPIVFTSIHDRGGHFAAHESPEALVGDLRKMFRLKSVRAKL